MSANFKTPGMGVSGVTQMAAIIPDAFSGVEFTFCRAVLAFRGVAFLAAATAVMGVTISATFISFLLKMLINFNEYVYIVLLKQQES